MKQHIQKGTILSSLLKEENRKDFICSKINGKVRQLDYVFEKDNDYEIEFLDLKDQNANRIYSASLRYVISMACHEIAPKMDLRFFYNISRAMFAKPLYGKNSFLSPAFVQQLSEKVEELIRKDLKIERLRISKEEALERYKKLGFKDKIDILKYRKENFVHLDECKDGDFVYDDYLYSFLVPSTGYLKKYMLRYYAPGFLVQVPRSECGGMIPEFKDEPTYAQSLQKNYLWSKNNQLDTIFGINRFIKNNSAMAFINLCEARINDMIAELGRMITSSETPIKVISIAGPSSSGKTSFANRLMFELMSKSLRPIRISMDDYFKTREESSPDISLESVEALNLELFNRQMDQLIRQESVTLPVYDFVTKKRKPGKTITLQDNQPLIVEGIHALDSQVLKEVSPSEKFRIFIAPQPQVNIDNHSPISMTDIRLLRRIARDVRTRNSDATETIRMWPDVRQGEFSYIYPTQENADYVFDSFVPYEFSALRNIVLPLLEKITPDQEEYLLACRLKNMVRYFLPIEVEDIPCNSIMREFVGGSCFKDAR